MTKPIILHHVPHSRSSRVLWALEELGLDYEVELYQIADGSTHSPEMLARSPAGRVPALEIDGTNIFESGAILQYLAETRPDAGLGRQAGDPDRVRYLEVIHFAETMASLIEQLNLNHVFLRDPSKASPTVIKLNTRRFEATLRALDVLLGDSEYVLPSGFSAADIMLGFNLISASYYVHLDTVPRILAYRGRLIARPALQAVLERDAENSFYSKDFYPIPEERHGG